MVFALQEKNGRRFRGRGAHRCGGSLAVAFLHGSLAVAVFAYVGFSIFMQVRPLSGC